MPAPSPNQVITVSELTRRLKAQLENTFPAVWIEGEISNLRVAESGHAYFTLKDANAQLSAVAFRGVAGRLGFKLADGMAVVAFGEISVYEKRGQYQLIVTQLLPKGLGALQLAFEQLKRKLAAEGLFETSRKKPLPVLPQRIGIVTSPAGAAIRDFLNIIGRRYPNLHIIINPVRVQGTGAAEEIAAAVDQFNTLNLVDVIIVTRGGGSLEDLWAFNEEIVARAIARSAIPTISAVGHEIDFTIADFVADLRAPTPSAAAELVVKSKGEFLDDLAQFQSRLNKDLRLQISEARRRLADCVLRHPVELIRQYRQQVDDLSHRLAMSPDAMLSRWQDRFATDTGQFNSVFARYRQDIRQRLAHAQSKLDLLSPKATLARGYSITRLADGGRLVRRTRDVATGAKVTTIVLDGEFDSVVSSPPKIKD